MDKFRKGKEPFGQGVKLIFTGGHNNLMAAFKGRM